MLALVGSFADLVFPYIVATAFAMARATGLALILPVFIRLGLTGILRNGVVFALSLPIVPVVLAMMQADTAPTTPELLGLLLKETLVGLLLGLAFGVPFWAAEAAGELLDLQRGSSSANLYDPLAMEETPITGTLLVIVLVALFLLAGGFGVLVDGLYRSYEVWPLRSFLPDFTPASALALLKLADAIMRLAFVLAGPIVIAMFLAELALALVARFAPQLNVFDLSLAVKSLVFVLVMPVYAAFMLEYMKGDLAPLGQVIDVMRGFFQ